MEDSNKLAKIVMLFDECLEVSSKVIGTAESAGAVVAYMTKKLNLDPDKVIKFIEFEIAKEKSLLIEKEKNAKVA